MLNRRSLWPALAALLLLALLISACGPAAEPTPEPTPTRPLRPTFTPTLLPTDTPTVVPTDTPTPEPTATPTELPTDTPEPTATPEPAVIISGSAEVNVRSGPSAAYPVVGKVAQGTELKIVARNDAGDWWQVCCVNGNEVWIVDRLVEIQGDTDGIQVAANVPPPPTPRPVPPTNTPEPTPTPAPVYAFDKYANPPGRPNSNPYVTFWGMVYTSDLNNGVGGVTLVVDGPLGRKEADCSSAVLRGDPGLPSEFIYNCKVEFQGTADGVYRAWVADSGGAQQSDIWENTVSGEIRIFMPRWKQR